MFIDSVEKIGKYRYKIKAENIVFYVYQSDIRKYAIKESTELPDEIYEDFINKTMIPRARKKALEILSRADCSEADLRKKLYLKNYQVEVIENAISYVKKFNYLNDARYAENFINYKSNSKSLRQIKMELFSKGIDSDIIEQIITDDRTDEEALHNLIKKKIKNLKEIDLDKKRKLYSYLYRKGFDTELISRVLSDYFYDT
ncbi:MAG: regulatory protein RecX [Catonella sp.]|uniref:regulatory protein RecX n=1 Tax=Catonella sp. TaxID=2382125 RepID=UPI003F9F87C7